MASSSTGEDPLYCGPEDPSVLYLQPYHITESIISENDTDPFQPRKLDNNIFQAQMHDRVLGHIERMGFGGIYHCGKPKMLDVSLIGALIERWRPETHTFHLPVGEATVTLQDIEVLWV
ncbi:protein MAIN-LIKE 1-like [Salvia hispanica]|uniref:protein MAIN-LIKE 1-like n=1 Tax=Salvia hispanica TaxID=49212 RepID=UPI002009318F|nr:protein MAIN-LIKE 1-like [Salvia hispanica]